MAGAKDKVEHARLTVQLVLGVSALAVIMLLGSLWIVYSSRSRGDSTQQPKAGTAPIQNAAQTPPGRDDPVNKMQPQQRRPETNPDEFLRVLWRQKVGLDSSDGEPVVLGDKSVALVMGLDHLLIYDSLGRQRCDYHPPYHGYMAARPLVERICSSLWSGIRWFNSTAPELSVTTST